MLLLKVRRLFSVWSMVVPISILLTVLKAEPEVLAASFLRVGRNGMNKHYSNTQGRRLLRFIQWHAQGKNVRLLKVSRVLSVFGMATSFPTQQHYKAKRQSWVKIQREWPCSNRYYERKYRRSKATQNSGEGKEALLHSGAFFHTCEEQKNVGRERKAEPTSATCLKPTTPFGRPMHCLDSWIFSVPAVNLWVFPFGF